MIENADRAYDEVGEGRLLTFCTVTGEGTACFKKVPLDLPRVRLFTLVKQCSVKYIIKLRLKH